MQGPASIQMKKTGYSPLFPGEAALCAGTFGHLPDKQKNTDFRAGGKSVFFAFLTE